MASVAELLGPAPAPPSISDLLGPDPEEEKKRALVEFRGTTKPSAPRAAPSILDAATEDFKDEKGSLKLPGPSLEERRSFKAKAGEYGLDFPILAGSSPADTILGGATAVDTIGKLYDTASKVAARTLSNMADKSGLTKALGNPEQSLERDLYAASQVLPAAEMGRPVAGVPREAPPRIEPQAATPPKPAPAAAEDFLKETATGVKPQGDPAAELVKEAAKPELTEVGPVEPAIQRPPEQLSLPGVADVLGPPPARPSAAAVPVAPTFYSAVERAVAEAKQDKAPAGQWKGMLANSPGVKAEEMQWLGLDDWLAEQKGPVAKRDLLDFISEHKVDVREVENKGSGSDPNNFNSPRYAQYTLPGGKGYRELLLTKPSVPKLPEGFSTRKMDDGRYEVLNAQGYRTGLPDETQQGAITGAMRNSQNVATPRNEFETAHFPGTPNILAHVRFNDRVGPEGEKILHLEEVQSDWHQQGKKRGYASERDALLKEVIAKEKASIVAHQLDHADKAEKLEAYKEAEARLNNFEAKGSSVPDAPFRSSWHELALKRMLRYAAENGYDRLTWTTGEQQTARYSSALRKAVDEIEWEKTPEGVHIRGFKKQYGDRDPVVNTREKESSLSDAIGKAMAKKILEDPNPKGTISGSDLRIDSTGMADFYDRMLPQFANKYAKKWGSRSEKSKIGNSEVGAWIAKSPDGYKEKAVQTFGEIRDLAKQGWTIRDNPHFQKFTTEVHSLPVTPAMRDSVLKGQPLFEHTGEAKTVPLPSNAREMNSRLLHGERPREWSASEAKAIAEVEKVLKRIAPRAQRRPMKKVYAQGEATGITSAPGAVEVSGAFLPRDSRNPEAFITWALESGEHGVGVARHEAIHYLRQEGFFTSKEWTTLEKAASDNGWHEQYEIPKRYPHASESLGAEEAVAEAFRYWRSSKGMRLPKGVREIFLKLDLALRQLAAGLRRVFGRDATAADIFTRAERGEVGSRELTSPASRSDGEGIPSQGRGEPPTPPSASSPGSKPPDDPADLFKWVRGQEDDLYRLRMNNEADREAARKYVKESVPKRAKNAAVQERAYHAVEEENAGIRHRSHEPISLTPEERSDFEAFTRPLMKEANEIAERLRKEGLPLEDTGYIHRIVKGKGSMYDALLGDEGSDLQGNAIYGRTLPRTTSSLKQRSIFMAETASGEKKLVRSPRKVGDEFTEDGKRFKVRQATTREIEERSPRELGHKVEYFKNALANTMDNLLRLKRVERNLEYLEKLKADPVFKEHAVAPGSEAAPQGWKGTDLPQLAGWKFDPKIANMLDDFYRNGKASGEFGKALEKVNHVLTSAIFINPVSAFFGHGLNVLTHWFVGRGWDNINPKMILPSSRNFMRAMGDVTNLTPAYRQMMREGNALLYAPTVNRNFHQAMLKLMGGEIAKDPKTWADIAKAAGTTPKAVLIALNDLSSRGLWWLNDILMLQRVYDLQHKGLDTRRAIAEAEKEIPNYRIPSEAWNGPGGRAYSEFMSSPNLLIFSRYRHGLMKAFAHTIRDAVKGSKGEKVRAAGQMLALAGLMTVIYPMADEVLKQLSGNPRAKWRRAGPASLVNNLTAKDKDFTNAMSGLFAPQPGTEMAVELGMNRNLFTGKDVYNPDGGPGEILGELGYYGATRFAPGEQAASILRGSKTAPQVLGNWIGAELPDARSEAMKKKFKHKRSREDTKAWKKSRGKLLRGLDDLGDIFGDLQP